MAAPFLACMAAVAAFYQLPPRALPAIQIVEGGQVGLVSRNANGSEDLGLMQVNTVWLAPLSRATAQPEAALRRRLIADGCFSVAVAGAILRGHLNDTGGDILAAVGRYHSRTPARTLAYQARVLAAARRIPAPLPARLASGRPVG
jgi:hypothetical protein